MITIMELAIYPVKSCRQLQVKRCLVDSFGFSGDRRWVLSDTNGRFITQRRHPELVLVSVKVTSTGITLSAPGLDCLEISIPVFESSRQYAVSVWNDSCHGLDAGQNASDWFSQYLRTNCRLIYMHDSFVRSVDPKYAGAGHRVGFADGFPFLLISEASLADLNARLDSSVSMTRFRPNIVVAGCDPYEEDQWDSFTVGAIRFECVKDCSRCVMTTIDTRTAKKTSFPLSVLAEYRRKDNGVIFGQNLIHHGEGMIEVGMEVKL